MDAALASPTPWQRLPADLATALRPRLATTERAVAQVITATVPAFARITDPKFEHDVHLAVRVALERFLDLVGTDEPALPPPVREAFVALGAAEAREDRSADALLSALRIASRQLLRTASGVLTEARPVETGELLDLSDAISAYIDELAAAGTEGYALQLREQAGEVDRRRRLLAQLLLRGGAPDGVVRAAAAAIGWHLLRAVTPVVLPPDAARDTRFRYGADGVVLERERDAVLLLREGPRAGRTQLAEALRGRAAVVGPTLDWTRVPEGVRLAELTAGASGDRRSRPVEPVFVDDHLAALALRGEPGALDVLASRRLAPLAGLRVAQRDRLLATLHSWLRHWGSRTEVSAELFVHPQTVSYRLKRLRELLGDDLDDPTARFELLLALAAGVGVGSGQPVSAATAPTAGAGRRPGA